MLSTLVIVALQDSRRVFWFSFDHWLRIPWFFSRGRTRLAFSFFFFDPKLFSFCPGRWFGILFSLVPGQGFFCFFLVPWILVDIRLVNIHIYIYIYTYPQIDCLIVSQLISMARHARHFKLGSKPGWLYASRISATSALAKEFNVSVLFSFVFKYA